VHGRMYMLTLEIGFYIDLFLFQNSHLKFKIRFKNKIRTEFFNTNLFQTKIFNTAKKSKKVKIFKKILVLKIQKNSVLKILVSAKIQENRGKQF